MSDKLLRGRLLSFVREPDHDDDLDAYRYVEDGAILIKDQLIEACGSYADLASRADTPIIDHRPHLMMPGFIDAHLHFPQIQVIGSWGAKLLDWLSDYTFPEEAKYADPGHAERMAGHFFQTLIDHGTTSAAAYCSVHAASVDAFFAEANRRNLRMIGGKVMMDREAPASVCDTAQSSYDDSKTLIERWHGKGRGLYAITPRFAITSTPAQLDAAGTLKAEHPDLHLQTHLSENDAEIARTAELYPDAQDYVDVYERYGLLGSKSLFGHCLHLSDRERAAMASSGSVAVFCPTSNLFLGSGLYDEAGLRHAGVRRAISTDVGGGTSYSMLKSLDEGYKILQLQHQKLERLRAFYWITLGNAQALSLADKIGTLDPGSEADIVILNAAATPAMALRMETINSLKEELFLLQTMGDDRAIDAVYAAGEPVKPAAANNSAAAE